MNRPLDAFDSKPMVLSVWFIGNQSIIGTWEGVGPAGIDQCDDGKGGSVPVLYGKLDKGSREMLCCLQSVIQQIAEQGGQVVFRKKINRSLADICMKINVLLIALSHIAAQNSIEHVMVAQADGFFQVCGLHELLNIGMNFLRFPIRI